MARAPATTTMLLVAAIMLAATSPAASAAIDITDKDLASEESLWALYERWGEHHGVAVVPRDLAGDKARRFDVFKENARMVHEFNRRGGTPYKLSLNLFGDMTDKEVDRMYGR